MREYLKNNYHTHTVRCQHAEGTEREYIEAAIAIGMKKLGFSDHTPCPFKDGYVSGIRMKMEEAYEYVTCLRQLKKEYEDRIEILIGFETEYVPEFFEEQLTLYHDLNIDYLIMGQHFWRSESLGPYSGAPTSDPDRIHMYVNSVLEGMATGKFTYLAHPDLMNFQGVDSVYEWEMTRLLEGLKEMNIPVEINMGGMGEGKHYPDDKFWSLVSKIGNDVIIGADAHSVAMLTDVDTYDRCKEIAERFELNLVDDIKLVKP